MGAEIHQLINTITVWLHTNPQYAGLIAFIVAFTESLAIIGGIVPGSVTMTALGVLIGTGVIHPTNTFIFAIIGAILGDAVSFAVGYKLRNRIHDIWPFKQYPSMLEKGERFFQQHGAKSIFLGRFVGPIRAILPLVAGSLKMSISRFIVADIISAIFWAPAYLLPGILLGAATLELPPGTASKLLLYVFGLLISTWLIGWLIRCSSRWLNQKIDSLLKACWYLLRSKRKLRPFAIMLQKADDKKHHGQLALACLTIFAFALFLLVGHQVATLGPLTNWNLPTLTLLQSMRTEWLDKIMLVITLFGEKKILIPVVAIITTYFLWCKDYRATIHWLANGVIAAAAVGIGKHLWMSQRPEVTQIIKATSSYPSGHTTLVTAIFGMFAMFITRSCSEYRCRMIWRATICLIALVGFSRLYLGAHWLTDVIGSIGLATAICSAVTVSYQRQGHKPIAVVQFSAVFIASLLVVGGTFSYLYFAKEKYAAKPFVQQHKITMEQWWQQSAPVLPLMQHNRLNQVIAPFNLQWAANLPQIKQVLAANGWKAAPEGNWQQTIIRLTSKDKTKSLPWLSPLYHYQKPVLIYTKQLNSHKPLLVLRLWRSSYHFTDSVLPLWIGNVHYRVLWHHRLLNSHQTMLQSLQGSLKHLQLRKDEFEWKRVLFATIYNTSATIKLIRQQQGTQQHATESQTKR